jgi:hypothetical protein
MKITTFPEIHVTEEFLQRKDDVIKSIIYIGDGIVDINLDHPVLGDVIEIYHHNKQKKVLTLKSVVLGEVETYEEAEIAQDYYNNVCLNGHDTYFIYPHPELGYYLSTRN